MRLCLSTLLMGRLHAFGVISGFNRLFSFVPGPVKLYPGKCISNGRLLIALLIKLRPLTLELTFPLVNFDFFVPQTTQIP